MIKILIAEDDALQRATLEKLIVKRFGYDVASVDDGVKALRYLRKHSPDLVILDLHMPGKDGLEVLQEIKARYADLPVILLTGSDDPQHAVQAMKLGAIDFLPKPAEPERLSVAVYHALKLRSMEKQLDQYQRREAGALQFDDVIGHNAGLTKAVKVARKAAMSELPVLITGQTGTGKEVMARAVHGESKRAGAPFVAVNCAAIPEKLAESTLFGHEKGAFTGAVGASVGKFREAQGGTLFLDEVGELTPEIQAKLLRALQEKQVEPVGGCAVNIDVRIVAATNRNLDQAVREGRFREDLMFRLNVLPLMLPPLQQRREDIPALITYFREKFTALYHVPIKEFSTDAVLLMCGYDWPGNVRELENVVQRLLVLSDAQMIGVDEVRQWLGGEAADVDAPSPTLSLVQPDGDIVPLAQVENAAIRFAYSMHRGNVTQTAKALGMAKPTLYKRLAGLGIRRNG